MVLETLPKEQTKVIRLSEEEAKKLPNFRIDYQSTNLGIQRPRQADHLNNRGFQRGAGAIAGVVMEGHLRSVGSMHKLVAPKNATLGKLNDILRNGGVIDIPAWRFNQHLIDLRNICDHKLTRDPSVEDVEELIAGVRKITKTIF